MGRKNELVKKSFDIPGGGKKTVEVELFTWEKLDYVDRVRAAFKLK
jgi:S-adenosylmethionine synthetase